MAKPKTYSMRNFDANQTTFACIHRLDQHSSELMLPIIPIVINVLWLRRLKFLYFLWLQLIFHMTNLFRNYRPEKNAFLLLWMPSQTKESYWMKLNKKQSLFRIYAF